MKLEKKSKSKEEKKNRRTKRELHEYYPTSTKIEFSQMKCSD
jgi:hypothetical protein